MPGGEGLTKSRDSHWLSLHPSFMTPRCAQALVTDLGTAELARSGGREALLFRENTLATKAIDEYMKLVAQDYLQETLGEPCVGVRKPAGRTRRPQRGPGRPWVIWVLEVGDAWELLGSWREMGDSPRG